jgi:putative transposase
MPGSPSRWRFACLPGGAWENGYCASVNSKLRDELLIGEIFYTLKEARIVIENWRRQ